ncbi:hypothetical protein GMA11_06705 [Granulicatella sp. zg-ZJ]|uniref:hypothetical protein n=1 Tax=unclassified Granulicatella TaxID=2630493 RepID=UPI0013C0EA91|nr:MULTISPECIES: hypothetical protein [unclassified Granulicatella]MBS4749993.1 hypothetical protein [Carnobacteriaceae bacterium zg-ZUI78]NEW63083.1 hypothetical protein [Granulicatella sp. zg-ZJ]NEW66191.1 hypothetical protein [Granulicatella sp. zg-84]QMI86052.1 hypothetical protein H1220_01380 [Carnobacteriaceae bacterium zg-84]
MYKLKEFFRNYKKLDRQYRQGIVAMISSLVFVFILYLGYKKDSGFLLGILCGEILTLILYFIYLYIQTKGFKKFAKLNDERLLFISDKSRLIASKITFSILITITGFCGGFLVADYEKYGGINQQPEKLVLWTVLIMGATIIVLFFIVMNVVYAILKRKM